MRGPVEQERGYAEGMGTEDVGDAGQAAQSSSMTMAHWTASPPAPPAGDGTRRSSIP